MDFVLRPSLKRMTEVKIVTELCSQRDFRSLIYSFHLPPNSVYHNEKVIETVESNVIESMDQLPLPDPLKKDLSRIIRPIARQVMHWRYFCGHDCYVNIPGLPVNFRWTPEGTIDWKKTTEILIRDESSDPEWSFQLACINCLEDQIPELWKRILEEWKGLYYSGKGPECMKPEEMVKFWAYLIHDDLSKLDGVMEELEISGHSYYFYAFQVALSDKNFAATKFFLDKLTAQVKVTDLDDYAKSFIIWERSQIMYNESPNLYFGQILHLLLLRMSENERKRVFEEFPYESFACFLEWPFQPLFMGLAERYAGLIRDNNVYNHLLKIILDRIDWKEFDYRYLLHHFWGLMPESYKGESVEDYIQGHLIHKAHKAWCPGPTNF